MSEMKVKRVLHPIGQGAFYTESFFKCSYNKVQFHFCRKE